MVVVPRTGKTGPSAIWGDVAGTLSDQEDLQAELSDIPILQTDKADKTNVLELDNTTAFTPEADYEPATKKYVDDATPALALDDLSDVDAPTPSEGDVIAYNSTSGDWEQSAQSGGGANLFIFDETPTETPNGVITNFSTVNVFGSGKIEVFKNGVRMTETDDYTEDADTNGVTFVTAPATDSKIRFNYLRLDQVVVGDSGTVYAETPTGLVNSTNTVYDTAHEYIAGTIRVVLNGVLQTLTDDYAETDSNTITFVTPPQTGDTLRCYYDRFLPSAGNASQLDGQNATDLVKGWINAVSTWTYTSWDATVRTGVIATASDESGHIQLGDRITFSQATDGTKYAIVTAITTSAITLFMYEGDDLDNETITSPQFSHQKNPYGFDIDPDKWNIIHEVTSLHTIASPVNGTWYNMGAVVPTPIGKWVLEYNLSIQFTAAAAGDIYLACNLSTNQAGVASEPMLESSMASNTTLLRIEVNREALITNTAKTNYYFNLQFAGAGTASNIYAVGSAASPQIYKVICAYL